jgi:hypothetical protein
MKIAIVGSRTFNDYQKLKEEIEKLISSGLVIEEIISGGAKGADTLAERFSIENNKIKFTVFKPEWAKYGRAAGKIRNTLIIENCDMLLAFWDFTSRGTKDSIEKARKINKDVLVIKI